MMKLVLRDARVDQTTRFYRQGSILGGTIKSGGLGVEVRIDIDSDEPAERVARLVAVARDSCFTHGALAEPVAVETEVRLNGQALAARPAR
jgi:organic hydroperoxide reductase OsmC/OhrA